MSILMLMDELRLRNVDQPQALVHSFLHRSIRSMLPLFIAVVYKHITLGTCVQATEYCW